MPNVIVIGGGLAGLAAAAALGQSGYDVRVLETRPFLGGRATSYSTKDDDIIDNCQHVLLRCCSNLLDFYQRMGVAGNIKFHSAIPFIEPGGRISVLEAGSLPAPLHFTGSFAKLKFLNWSDKIAIGRALAVMYFEHGRRKDLDDISMLDWLVEKGQTSRAIERFWRQVLVSAINEELGNMAAAHGFQVFWLGFLSDSKSYHMGVPSLPLAELYGSQAWNRIPSVQFNFRSSVQAIHTSGGRITGLTANGELLTADAYVSAIPFERLEKLFPELGIDYAPFHHSSITGIHLWFDRPITDLENATLLDRNIQWMFNKQGGHYVQLVVSASKNMIDMGRQEIIDLALSELADFFPIVREAKLEKAQVVKEVRATFMAAPGLEAKRPLSNTKFANFYLAGDWTRSGWPATMEGAVRSGYLAAEAVMGNTRIFASGP